MIALLGLFFGAVVLLVWVGCLLGGEADRREGRK